MIEDIEQLCAKLKAESLTEPRIFNTPKSVSS